MSWVLSAEISYVTLIIRRPGVLESSNKNEKTALPLGLFAVVKKRHGLVRDVATMSAAIGLNRNIPEPLGPP